MADALFSALGSAFGSLFGGGNSQEAEAERAAQRQYQYNLKLQKQQQKYNTEMYAKRYQMQREDLEKAGINPLYGLGSAPTVTSGLNSVGMPDFVGERNGKMQNLIGMLGVANEYNSQRAQIKKTEQETKTEKMNTELVRLETLEKIISNGNLDKQQKAQISNLISQTNTNIKNLDLIDSQIGVNKSQIGVNNSQTNVNKANEKYINSNTWKNYYLAPSEKKLNEANSYSAVENAKSARSNINLQRSINQGTIETQEAMARFLKNNKEMRNIAGASHAMDMTLNQIGGGLNNISNFMPKVGYKINGKKRK